MGMFDFGSKPKKKKGLAYYKSQIKKANSKLELKAAKKKLEEIKNKL